MKGNLFNFKLRIGHERCTESANVAQYAHDSKKISLGPYMYLHTPEALVSLHQDLSAATNTMIGGTYDVWKFVTYSQWPTSVSMSSLRKWDCKLDNVCKDVNVIVLKRYCGWQVTFVRDWHEVYMPHPSIKVRIPNVFCIVCNSCHFN